MNPIRRATPDSEAVGSSEDERPWPASMSFGKFPMKENSVPGMPGGIWGTQKRGSFKISDVAQRNAARDAARLGAAAAANVPVAGLRGASTPSPSVSEGAGALPFAIPLQPTPKTGRSLSHSQGQREAPLSAGSIHGPAAGPAAGAALPLGLLAEEETDTDTESDVGSRLTHTTSHPPIGSLMRTSTFPAAYDTMPGANSSRDRDRDRQAAPHSPTHRDLLRTRTFEAAFADLSMDHPHRRASQWQSSLGWDDVPNVNESRRHSLADIPTRRGSLAGGEPSLLSRTYTHEVFDTESPTSLGPAHLHSFNSDRVADTKTDQSAMDASSHANPNVPEMYRMQRLPLNDSERHELEVLREQTRGGNYNYGSNGSSSRYPKKMFFMVSFKCSRVDVFYLLDNTGLAINEGDLVIVEADRGQDLGTVQHANVTQDEARAYKKKYAEEQYKWLMMYSRNKEGASNPNALVHGQPQTMFPHAPTSLATNLHRESFNNLKPKAIKRLASEHEIRMLAEKEGNEAKAKRTCQQKVAQLGLKMEILDAEWQWDFQKLIFYYYADTYINFNGLITELYRIYKTRIWLSAINPASFSNTAMRQPPSGIGPGAVGTYNYSLNNSYTMAYGEDQDPFGARMPYNIPYETYNPNYPSIPGISNSFAPVFGSDPYGYYNSTAPSQNGRQNANLGLANTVGTLTHYPMYSRGGNDGMGGHRVNPPDGVASNTGHVFTPTDVVRGGNDGHGDDIVSTPANHAAQNFPGSQQSMPYGHSKFPDFSPMGDSPQQSLGFGDSAAGLRRQSDLPAPIGTRRASETAEMDGNFSGSSGHGQNRTDEGWLPGWSDTLRSNSINNSNIVPGSEEAPGRRYFLDLQQEDSPASPKKW